MIDIYIFIFFVTARFFYVFVVTVLLILSNMYTKITEITHWIRLFFNVCSLVRRQTLKAVERWDTKLYIPQGLKRIWDETLLAEWALKYQFPCSWVFFHLNNCRHPEMLLTRSKGPFIVIKITLSKYYL